MQPGMMHGPVILIFRRLRQENYEFRASLIYVLIPCLRKPKTKKKSIGD